jgi:hypothetical protein
MNQNIVEITHLCIRHRLQTSTKEKSRQCFLCRVRTKDLEWGLILGTGAIKMNPCFEMPCKWFYSIEKRVVAPNTLRKISEVLNWRIISCTLITPTVLLPKEEGTCCQPHDKKFGSKLLKRGCVHQERKVSMVHNTHDNFSVEKNG